MCLILFALQQRGDYPLILAANRDEYHDRPTAAAGPWPEAPGVVGGRDLAGGGTWLGITREGRLAAVTNYRDPAERAAARRSRGELVREFLLGRMGPEAYLERVAGEAVDYQGFNLLVGIGTRLWYFSNREGRARPLGPGVHGLSNHLLDTPWPKVAGGKRELARLLATEAPPTAEALLEVLADGSRPPDELLPDTGVGIERERLLSSRFIAGPAYGTRCSTVLLLEGNGRVSLIERSFGPDRLPAGERRHRFYIPPW